MLRLACLGDWGNRGRQLDNVSDAINRTEGVSHILFLGDNFYENGVSSVDDPLWNEIFVQKFRGDRHYMAILGNHDYHQSPEAQVKYNKHGWFMPSRFYSQRLLGNKLVVVFIDTVLLDPVTSIMNGVNPLKLKWSTEHLWNWVEQQLIIARSPGSETNRIIVAGHYPIFSNGPHGDSKKLTQRLSPLLEKYNVDMYICGHEHNFQHFKKGSVHYVVCGSGGKVGYAVRQGRDLLWSSQEAGYLELNVREYKVEAVFRDQTRRPLYFFWL
jgi:tartrate-resistant acid phosphatase type 5